MHRFTPCNYEVLCTSGTIENWKSLIIKLNFHTTYMFSSDRILNVTDDLQKH